MLRSGLVAATFDDLLAGLTGSFKNASALAFIIIINPWRSAMFVLLSNNSAPFALGCRAGEVLAAFRQPVC